MTPTATQIRTEAKKMPIKTLAIQCRCQTMIYFSMPLGATIHIICTECYEAFTITEE